MQKSFGDGHGRPVTAAAMLIGVVLLAGCSSSRPGLRLPIGLSRNQAVFDTPEGFRTYADALFQVFVTCVERNSGTRAAVCLTYSRCLGCFSLPPADATKLSGTVLGEGLEWQVWDQNGLITARAEVLPRLRGYLCGPDNAVYLELYASSADDLPGLKKIAESLRIEAASPPCR